MQLTNILRDLREDAANGRAYLPGEDLRRFGLLADGAAAGDGARGAAGALAAAIEAAAGQPGSDAQATRGAPSNAAQEQLAQLVRFEAERAREWFARGITLAPLLDRRSAACLLAMAGIYRRLLERIAAHPERALRGRISLPAREKAWVAARGLLAGARA